MENEKRLIDANALAIGPAKREIFVNPAYADGWNSAINIIENAPTVDAVEVVHCGSCRHASDEYDNGWLWCNEWQSGSHCGGYCHKGERKDNGNL